MSGFVQTSRGYMIETAPVIYSLCWLWQLRVEDMSKTRPKGNVRLFPWQQEVNRLTFFSSTDEVQFSVSAISTWTGSSRRHSLAFFAKYLSFTTYNRRTCLFKRIYLQKVNPDEGRESHSTKSFSNLHLVLINSRWCLFLPMPGRIVAISFFLFLLQSKLV